MTPKTITYWTPHPDRAPERWMRILSLDERLFRLEWDAAHPDYIFATEQIYSSYKAYRSFLRLYKQEAISIFFAGECIFPDMNLFDYAVCFDRHFTLDDRIGRRPCISFFSQSIFHPMGSALSPSEARKELGRKTGFCSFVYSNGRAHPHRDWLFHVLSQYGKVDSLGRHLNNCANVISQSHPNWRQQAIDLKRPYKFAIASENAVYNGYITEKILSSFQAHAVPIYWGDPDCASEFNPRAFINANGLSEEELLKRVREVDENDDLWVQMISEPAMTSEQICAADHDETIYREFTKHVFSQEKSKAKRAPSGFWPGIYQTAFRDRSPWPWLFRILKEGR